MEQARPDRSGPSASAAQRVRRWSTVSLVLLGVALLMFPVFLVYAFDTIPLYGNPVRTESARTAYAVAVAGAVVSALGLGAAVVSWFGSMTTRAVVAAALNALVLLQIIAVLVA